MSLPAPPRADPPASTRDEPLWYQGAVAALELAGFPPHLVRAGIPGRALPKLFALGIAATVIAIVQYTPWGPFPDRMDSTFAGIAAGLAGGPLAIGLLHRIRRALRTD